MTVSKLFFPAGVKIDSTYLGHVGNQSADNALEDLTIMPSGHAFPNFTGSKSKAPELQLSTTAIAQLMDLLSTDTYLHADLSAVVVDLYYRAALAFGMNEDPTDATKHVIYRLEDNALLYWESISGSQDDDGVQINFRIAAAVNGVNDMVQLPAAAIETPATILAPYTLGPIQVNGSQIDGVKNFTWSNNFEVVKEAADGDEGPTFLTIKSCRPVIAFSTTNLKTIAGFDADGDAVTTYTQYLRKRRPNRINYADADLEHIKLSAAVGGAPPSGDAVGTLKWKQTANDGLAQVEIHLQESQSGAAIFAYAKDQAIT